MRHKAPSNSVRGDEGGLTEIPEHPLQGVQQGSGLSFDTQRSHVLLRAHTWGFKYILQGTDLYRVVFSQVLVSYLFVFSRLPPPLSSSFSCPFSSFGDRLIFSSMNI